MQASETAELVEKLEDSQMTLGSMASNRYSAPFREDVNGWINKLSTVSEIVEQWLMVQSMWMYMEAVFSGGDIVKQLPQEAKRFQNIDKAFIKVRFKYEQLWTHDHSDPNSGNMLCLSLVIAWNASVSVPCQCLLDSIHSLQGNHAVKLALLCDVCNELLLCADCHWRPGNQERGRYLFWQ